MKNRLLTLVTASAIALTITAFGDDDPKTKNTSPPVNQMKDGEGGVVVGGFKTLIELIDLYPTRIEITWKENRSSVIITNQGSQLPIDTKMKFGFLKGEVYLKSLQVGHAWDLFDPKTQLESLIEGKADNLDRDEPYPMEITQSTVVALSEYDNYERVHYPRGYNDWDAIVRCSGGYSWEQNCDSADTYYQNWSDSYESSGHVLRQPYLYRTPLGTWGYFAHNLIDEGNQYWIDGVPVVPTEKNQTVLGKLGELIVAPVEAAIAQAKIGKFLDASSMSILKETADYLENLRIPTFFENDVVKDLRDMMEPYRGRIGYARIAEEVCREVHLQANEINAFATTVVDLEGNCDQALYHELEERVIAWNIGRERYVRWLANLGLPNLVSNCSSGAVRGPVLAYIEDEVRSDCRRRTANESKGNGEGYKIESFLEYK